MKGRYNYNPHRHVKIWLSKKENVFLNIENQMRLIKIAKKNATDKIYFIYDSKLLTETAITQLEAFCKKRGNIIPKDVTKDIIPACQTTEEKNLLTIYEDEITHLDKGGNLAVCSDILRWLEPVYTLGTYSDFDVDIDTTTLPANLSVNTCLLLNLGSFDQSLSLKDLQYQVTNDFFLQPLCDLIIKPLAACFNRFPNPPANPESVFITTLRVFVHKHRKYCNDWLQNPRSLLEDNQIEDFLKVQYASSDSEIQQTTSLYKTVLMLETVILNNNLLAVVDADQARPIIQNIQSVMYQACSVPQPNTSSFQDILTKIASELTERFPPALVMEILRSLKSQFGYLPRLHDRNQGKSARKMRKKIISLTSNNETFCQEASKTVSDYAKMLQSTTAYKEPYPEISEEDDEICVTKERQEQRFVLLKDSVVYTTGPGKLFTSIFPHVDMTYTSSQLVDEQIVPAAFSHYGLERAFIVKPFIPLHTTIEQMVFILRQMGQEIGQASDLSWLEEGAIAICQREEIIQARREQLLHAFTETYHDILQQYEQTFSQAPSRSLQQNGLLLFPTSVSSNKKQGFDQCLAHFTEQGLDVKEFTQTVSDYEALAPHLQDENLLNNMKKLALLVEEADDHDLIPDTGIIPIFMDVLSQKKIM